MSVHFSDLATTFINSTQCKQLPSLSHLPLPGLKAHAPHPPTSILSQPSNPSQWKQLPHPQQPWSRTSLPQSEPSPTPIGNMSWTYTIRTGPDISPVQHDQWKIPIEFQEQIEHTLDNMVNKGMIALVSQPLEWVSSLMYPHKPDGTLHICLNPKDLNKAIV